MTAVEALREAGADHVVDDFHGLSVAFLNAIGRLKRQAGLVTLGAALFVPLGVVLGRRWGAVGICWALILVSLPVAFSNPIEAFRALRK